MANSSLEMSEDRLSRALNALRGAIDSRLDKEREWHNLESQLVIAHEDRAELAERLDHSLAENHRLEKISREVSVRVDNAIETIKDVIELERGAR
jgi:predicted  nucleic acid-binding Zn-ribbon protein